MLLDVVPGTMAGASVVLAEEVFRIAIGRGVLGGGRVGVGEKCGNVVLRASDALSALGGVER